MYFYLFHSNSFLSPFLHQKRYKYVLNQKKMSNFVEFCRKISKNYQIFPKKRKMIVKKDKQVILFTYLSTI